MFNGSGVSDEDRSWKDNNYSDPLTLKCCVRFYVCRVKFDCVEQHFKSTGDGFGNQSSLMVHLLTLANLLVQFRHKKTTSLSFLNVFIIEDALSVQ